MIPLTQDEELRVTAILAAVERSLQRRQRTRLWRSIEKTNEKYELLRLNDRTKTERRATSRDLTSIEVGARSLRRLLARPEIIQMISPNYPEFLRSQRYDGVPGLDGLTRGLTLLRVAAQRENRLQGTWFDNPKAEIEPLEWLYAVGLPRSALRHLSILPKFSRPSGGGPPHGAILAFVSTALEQLAVSPLPAIETIARGVHRYRHGQKDSEGKHRSRRTLGKASAK